MAYEWWFFIGKIILYVAGGIAQPRLIANLQGEQMDVGQNGRPMWDHRCELV